MSAELQVRTSATAMPSRRRSLAGLLATTASLLGGCSSNSSIFSSNSNFFSTNPPPPTSAPAAPATTIGTGQVKVGLILPLSAGGNAGLAGQAMRNAAEMALADFNAPNIQLLVEDDAGNADAARAVAQQALDQGAEIILGPLFAQSVSVVGQVTRPRNIPVIAFSTDANVASPGVYLLSFLPESDVERIVQYASSTGKRSYAALVPDNPYGTVVEAAFRQDVARHGGQIIALEHYPHDNAGMAAPVRAVAQAAVRADALFVPDGGDAVPDVVQMLVADGVNSKRIQLLGTGLWDDPRIYATPALDGGWYAAPDAAGYRNFSGPLSRALQPGPGAHCDACLRRGRARCGAGENATGPAAEIFAASPDQPVRFYRHRRAVPLPPRRHQRARARSAACHAIGAADGFAGAAQLRNVGDLEAVTPPNRRPRHRAPESRAR